MRPRVGLRNLVSILKQVVLPAPLGPIKAWMVRRLTRRLTPLTAINPANSLVKSSVSRIISLLIRTPSGGIVGALRRMSRPVAYKFSRAKWAVFMRSATAICSSCSSQKVDLPHCILRDLRARQSSENPRKRELELVLLPGAGCGVIGRRQARDRRWTTLSSVRLLDAVAQRRLYVDVGGGAGFQHARPGFLMDR